MLTHKSKSNMERVNEKSVVLFMILIKHSEHNKHTAQYIITLLPIGILIYFPSFTSIQDWTETIAN